MPDFQHFAEHFERAEEQKQNKTRNKCVALQVRLMIVEEQSFAWSEHYFISLNSAIFIQHLPWSK